MGSMGIGRAKPHTNLVYLFIGLFGVGNYFLFKKNRKYENHLLLQAGLVGLAIFLRWLRIKKFHGVDNILYLFYIVSILGTFYYIGKKINLKKRICGWILIMGEYTLFSYLYQMVVISMLFYLLPKPFNFVMNQIIFLFVNFVLILTLYWVRFQRKSTGYIDKIYRFVFS